MFLGAGDSSPEHITAINQDDWDVSLRRRNHLYMHRALRAVFAQTSTVFQHERRAGYEMGLPDADFLRSGGADVAGTFERRSQSQ